MGALAGALTEACHADCQATAKPFLPLRQATTRLAKGPNCTTEAQAARDRAQWAISVNSFECQQALITPNGAHSAVFRAFARLLHAIGVT